jgi:hypothetical protein
MGTVTISITEDIGTIEKPYHHHDSIEKTSGVSPNVLFQVAGQPSGLSFIPSCSKVSKFPSIAVNA